MCIENKVKKVIADLSGEEQVHNQASLQTDLALDSLSMVMLLVEIEEAFHIQLKEADMNPFELTTVQDVIHMVEGYRNGEEG